MEEDTGQLEEVEPGTSTHRASTETVGTQEFGAAVDAVPAAKVRSVYRRRIWVTIGRSGGGFETKGAPDARQAARSEPPAVCMKVVIYGSGLGGTNFDTVASVRANLPLLAGDISREADVFTFEGVGPEVIKCWNQSSGSLGKLASTSTTSGSLLKPTMHQVRKGDKVGRDDNKLATGPLVSGPTTGTRVGGYSTIWSLIQGRLQPVPKARGPSLRLCCWGLRSTTTARGGVRVLAFSKVLVLATGGVGVNTQAEAQSPSSVITSMDSLYPHECGVSFSLPPHRRSNSPTCSDVGGDLGGAGPNRESCAQAKVILNNMGAISHQKQLRCSKRLVKADNSTALSKAMMRKANRREGRVINVSKTIAKGRLCGIVLGEEEATTFAAFLNNRA